MISVVVVLLVNIYIYIYMVNNVVHLSFDLNRREQKVVEEVGEVSRGGSGVIETLRANN